MPSWEGWAPFRLDAFSFYFLGTLARDDLGQPGENVMVFGEAIEFVRLSDAIRIPTHYV